MAVISAVVVVKTVSYCTLVRVAGVGLSPVSSVVVIVVAAVGILYPRYEVQNSISPSELMIELARYTGSVAEDDGMLIDDVLSSKRAGTATDHTNA